MTELKPCPFCGSGRIQDDGAWVVCMECNASTKVFRDGNCRDRWNRRVNEPDSQPKPEFDPNEVICPWCGLAVTRTHAGKNATFLDIPIGCGVRETWHYECRVAYVKAKKSKGWLRRFLEWIWIGERI